MKRLFILMLILGICFTQASFAEILPRTAKILELEGSAEVKTPYSGWVPAEVGMTLTEGDIIKTEAGALAVILLEGKSETADVELKGETKLRLTEFIENTETQEQTTMLDIAMGEILVTSQKLRAEKSKFEVRTPTSIVGVRGTMFTVKVERME